MIAITLLISAIILLDEWKNRKLEKKNVKINGLQSMNKLFSHFQTITYLRNSLVKRLA